MSQVRVLLVWSRWLEIASILFAIQSLTWIVFGSFDPFGFYDSMLARALFDKDSLTADQLKVLAFGVRLLGSTCFGYFCLLFFIVRFSFRNGEPWAHTALAMATLAWFVLDSTFSIYMGASFNVYLVNVPCLIILWIPLIATWRIFHISQRQDDIP